ncbi:MAG: arsenate reductase (glutaredoxin) [Rhodospirillales bacterium]|nr:arsenate reductase (glutaredoxin) [Rhodospirillales bacterium]MCW8952355.1 arsenate reductase (glutaredoxin) [Rhodospirillales bacterium]MCW8971396.1 arsenate reductase (glutaredoxin) [Rhodospirillales bacterium]MCW9002039.1 arsenate reductase (glutaredoxin) [Rhodospirillales bacterium]MCW9040684.1 arsenate reductase (glutaredoxin) [Rhodospirillales bacterium]
MSVTIYHNPRCSKSRQTLEILRGKGIEPEVVEYLNNPPSEKELKEILSKLGISPRDLLRKKEAKEAGLDDPALSEAALIKGMAANPVVIERPIVVSGNVARLGRPPEKVLEIV